MLECQRLLYAERYVSEKNGKLSVGDLVEQPLLAATLTADDIADVPLEEVLSLMNAVSSASPGPSIQAVSQLWIINFSFTFLIFDFSYSRSITF